MMLDHMPTLGKTKWDSQQSKLQTLGTYKSPHLLSAGHGGSAIWAKFTTAALSLVLDGLIPVSAAISHHTADILGRDELVQGNLTPLGVGLLSARVMESKRPHASPHQQACSRSGP